MNIPIQLLVIETNAPAFGRLEKALEELVEEGVVNVEVRLSRVGDLQSANAYLDDKTGISVEGVISNVIFPSEDMWGKKEPNGRVIAEKCLLANKPFVWLSTDPDYDEAEKELAWGRERGFDIIANIPVIAYLDFDQMAPIREMWINSLVAVLAKATA